MTEYKNLVQDFARRTIINLEIIKDYKANTKGEVYEVTQLINSMLGLLVLPREHFIDEIPETPLKDLENEGWPRIQQSTKYDQCNTLRALIKNLRNAIAHFNVEFRTGVDEEIVGLCVWDEYTNRKKNRKEKIRHWEAEMTLETLEKFARCFSDIL